MILLIRAPIDAIQIEISQVSRYVSEQIANATSVCLEKIRSARLLTY